MPSSRAEDRIELNTANAVVGGTFTSRINMNLREDKHWSYGARSSLPEALGQRPWLLSAPVQSDKTLETIAEIRRELAEFVGRSPRRRRRSRRSSSATCAACRASTKPTPRSVARSPTSSGSGAPTTGYARSSSGSRRRRTRASSRLRSRAFRPEALTWVIVGDLASIEEPIRGLGLGTVQVLDADGKVLR